MLTAEFDRRIAELNIGEIQSRLIAVEQLAQEMRKSGQEVVDKIVQENQKLDQKDAKLSQKLTAEFARLDQGVESHKTQSDFLKETVQRMQLEMAQLQAKQIETFHQTAAAARVEIERLTSEVKAYVSNEMARAGSTGGGARSSQVKLNNPKETTVEVISENMTKANFQLWRSNLDLHLENFEEFGAGIGIFLRLVRLGAPMPRGKQDKKHLVEEYIESVNFESVEGGGEQMYQSWWDLELASRELYINLSASASMSNSPATCASARHTTGSSCIGW